MANRSISTPRRRGCFFMAPQFWAGAGITGFFLLMMFLLWRREVAQPAAMRKLGLSADLLTVTWADYSQFMYLERDGERIGGSYMRLSREPELEIPGKIGYDLRSRYKLKTKAANFDVSASMDVYVHMNDLFELSTFQGQMSGLGQEFGAEAFAEGKELYYRFKLPPLLLKEEERAKGAIVGKKKLDQPVMLAQAILPLVTTPEKLRVGNKWSAIGGDPFFGSFDVTVFVEVEAQEELVVNGEKHLAYRVKETTRSQSGDEVATISWYDPKGKILKTDMGNRMTMTKVPDREVDDFLQGFGMPFNFPDMKDKLKGEIRADATEQADGLMDRLRAAMPDNGF